MKEEQNRRIFLDTLGYQTMATGVCDFLSRGMDIPLDAEKINNQEEYTALRGSLERIITEIISGQTRDISEFGTGDEIRVVKAAGFNPEMESSYLFGGTPEDLPLGTEAMVLHSSPRKLKVFPRNEVHAGIWNMHPSEVQKSPRRNCKPLETGRQLKNTTHSIIEIAENAVFNDNSQLISRIYATKQAVDNALMRIQVMTNDSLQQLSLNISAIDKQMVNSGRLPLNVISRAVDTPEEEAKCRALAPRIFSEKQARLDAVLKLNLGVRTPCALQISGPDELGHHLSIIYQVSRANWVLSKRNNPKFPSMSCGTGANDVFAALNELGYLSAVRVSTDWGHGYVALPIVLNNGSEGLIGVDPTSDQIRSFGRRLHPNNVFVVSRRQPKLLVSDHTAYYPSTLYYLGVDNLRPEEVNRKTVHGDKAVSSYINQAFSNPVKLRLLVPDA